MKGTVYGDVEAVVIQIARDINALYMNMGITPNVRAGVSTLSFNQTTPDTIKPLTEVTSIVDNNPITGAVVTTGITRDFDGNIINISTV